MNDIRERSYESSSSEKSYALVIFAVILLAAGAIGLWYYLTLPKAEYAISANAFSRLDAPTRQIAIRLNEEPCNRMLARRLSAALTGASEYAAAISFIQNTEKKCGPNIDLMESLAVAQKGVSDFEAAEQTLTRVLETYPSSGKAYFNRGEIRALHGDISGSYEDIRKAIYVFSDPSKILYRAFESLAQNAAKLGRPCEAVAILQDYTTFDSLERRTPEVLGLIHHWQEQGACPNPFGNGKTRLKYIKGRGAIILPVKVNGAEARMIVDTGASRTSLTRSFAAHAGIEPSKEDGSMTQTANGAVWVMGGRAKTISLGDAQAANIPVFIQTSDQKDFGPGIDGLLGLSFLGNFKFTVNDGVLELEPLS